MRNTSEVWIANLSTNRNEALQSISCYAGNAVAETVAKTFAYSVLIVAALIGNILSRRQQWEEQSTTSSWTWLFLTSFSHFLHFPEFSSKHTFSSVISGSFGLVLCKIINFSQFLSAAVSIQSLVLIAIERLGAVVFPFRPPIIGSKLCPYFILATWQFTARFPSPINLSTSVAKLRVMCSRMLLLGCH